MPVTRSSRDVALKLRPETFAPDPERSSWNWSREQHSLRDLLLRDLPAWILAGPQPGPCLRPASHLFELRAERRHPRFSHERTATNELFGAEVPLAPLRELVMRRVVRQ